MSNLEQVLASRMNRYETLKMKAITIRTQVNQHMVTARQLKESYDEWSNTLLKEKENGLIQDSSITVLKEMIDKVSQEHIERLVDLISYSLQTIFFDKDYSLEVIMGDKRSNKTAEFYLVEKTQDTVIRSSFDGGIGGGILAVVGFVLQVYYLGYLNQASVMFCDESFSQVSAQYVGNLISFINELSDQKGFIFVLISHDNRLIPYAKRTYEVVSGVVTQLEGDHNG